MPHPDCAAKQQELTEAQAELVVVEAELAVATAEVSVLQAERGSLQGTISSLIYWIQSNCQVMMAVAGTPAADDDMTRCLKATRARRRALIMKTRDLLNQLQREDAIAEAILNPPAP